MPFFLGKFHITVHIFAYYIFCIVGGQLDIMPTLEFLLQHLYEYIMHIK